MTIMWQEILEQPTVMEKCRIHNEAAIRQAVEAMEHFNPHTVVFTGRGSSDHAGQYGRYLIEIFKGIPVSFASPSVITNYGGRLNYAGCVVIGISQSGMTKDVLEVLKAANAQGALTLSITNDPASPVAMEASIHLSCEAGPELSVEATKTFATQMYLLYLLVAQWTRNPLLLERAKTIPALVSAAIALEGTLTNIVPRYRFVREMFILARGTALPVAMEGCLKINESSYVQAKAFSIIDFFHGPVAMVEKDTPIIMLDVEAITRVDIAPMVAKVRAERGDLFVITNDPALAKTCAQSVLLPAEYDGPEAAFCVMALLQMFACKLSQLKEYNPDKPRGLQKITG